MEHGYSGSVNSIFIDDIITECASRNIPNSVVSPRVNHIISKRQYKLCWAALNDLLRSEMDEGHSVSIPNLGVFSHRIYNLGIRIPNFELSEKFSQRYDLDHKGKSISVPHRNPVVRLNYESAAQLAGLEKDMFSTALNQMLDKAGAFMASGNTVALDFGIGMMVCERMSLIFNFTQRPDRPLTAKEPKGVPAHRPKPFPRAGRTLTSTGAPSLSSLAHTPRTLNVGGNMVTPSLNVEGGTRAGESAPAGGTNALPCPPPTLPHQETARPFSPGATAASGKPKPGVRGRTLAKSLSIKKASLGLGMERGGSITPRGGGSSRVEDELGSTAGSPREASVPNQKHSFALRGLGAAVRHQVHDVTELIEDLLNYPPLLDTHSRTLAAPIDDERFQRVVSDRIGGNYTEAAVSLALDPQYIGVLDRAKVHEVEKGGEARRRLNALGSGGRAGLLSSKNTAGGGGSSLRGGGLGGQGSMGGPERVQTPRDLRTAKPWRRNPTGFDARVALGPSLEEQRMASATDQVTPLPSFLQQLETHRDGEDEEAMELELAVTNGKAQGRDLEAEVEARYLFYITRGIPDTSIATMKELWISNVLHSLPDPPQALSPEQVDQVVSALLHEMRSDYRTSVKKSMMNYVLKSKTERRRLLIPFYPADCGTEGWGWGEGKLVAETPPQWRLAVDLARNAITQNLLITDSCMVQVLALWQNYSDLLLVDVPTNDRLAQDMGWRPMEVEAFERAQLAHCVTQRDILLNQWYPAALAIFTRAAGEGAFDLPLPVLERYFEAVAVLMGVQLRGLVMRSIGALAAFFRRFSLDEQSPAERSAAVKKQKYGDPRLKPAEGAEDLHTAPYAHKETSIWRPAFTVKLIVEGEGIRLLTPPSDIQACVLHVFDNLVSCMSDLVRVEHRGLSLNGTLTTRRHLTCPSLDEASILEARNQLVGVIRENLEGATDQFRLYDRFLFLLDGQEQHADEFVGEDHPLDRVRSEIGRYKKAAQDVVKDTPAQLPLNLVLLDLSPLNASLSTRATGLADRILRNIAADNTQRNQQVCKSYKAIVSRLNKKPSNSHELVASETYMQQVRAVELAQLGEEVWTIKQRLDFLFEQGYRVTEELLTPAGATFAWVKKIDPALEERAELLGSERTKLENKFNRNRDAFLQKLAATEEQVASFSNKHDTKQLWEYVEQIAAIKAQLEAAETTVVEMNQEEERLGWPATSFTQAASILTQLQPYDRMWSCAAEFHRSHTSWLRGAVFNLEASTVESSVASMHDTVVAALAQLTEGPNPQLKVAEVGENLRAQLDAFKPSIPLIAAICNKGLRDRHWKQMAETVGFPIKPDEHSSLQRFIELGVDTHLEALQAISDSASKEWAIERGLERMQEDWAPLEFPVQSYKNTGTFILASGAGMEETTQVLDEQLVRTQSMRGSPHAAPFAERIQQWEAQLIAMQDIMEAWAQVQVTWLYLEPIFSSDDIQKQMPGEGKKFSLVDGHWRSIMKAVAAQPRCLALTKVERMLPKLTECAILLEEIQHGLTTYLESKRLFFPRFYFLSDDELLEMLSQSRDPVKVQPHLHKLFGGVAQLEFMENLDITAMISADGERVPFAESLNPAVGRGAVEVWLMEAGRVMRSSMLLLAQEAVADYSSKPRTQWALEWPGQLVLAASQLYWTMELEAVLREQASHGLSLHLASLNDQLAAAVSMLRGDTGASAGGGADAAAAANAGEDVAI